MDLTLATELGTQMGTAAVLGWMWVSERRASARRERLLEESHALVMRQAGALRETARAIDGAGEAIARQTRAVERIETGLSVLSARLGGGLCGRTTQAQPAD